MDADSRIREKDCNLGATKEPSTSEEDAILWTLTYARHRGRIGEHFFYPDEVAWATEGPGGLAWGVSMQSDFGPRSLQSPGACEIGDITAEASWISFIRVSAALAALWTPTVCLNRPQF